MTLKKASPSQIKAYLDLEAQKKIEKEWLYKNVILSSKEKENRIKKETISDRAIKSSLKRLTNKETPIKGNRLSNKNSLSIAIKTV